MSTELIIAIISASATMAGVVIGAGLQYLFSRATDKNRHERELRASAYASYLVAIGEMETVRLLNDPARVSDVVGRAISAKTRICVHGSKEAVDALSKLEGNTDTTLTEAKKGALLQFLSTVRKDLGSPGIVNEAEIDKILFKRAV